MVFPHICMRIYEADPPAQPAVGSQGQYRFSHFRIGGVTVIGNHYLVEDATTACSPTGDH